jgi:hypothetical protein
MMDLEKMCERLMAKMETDKEDLMVQMDAKLDAYQEKAEAKRKEDKEDFLAKLEVNQDKADAMLAKLDADKEEMKAAMQSMRSELDESIQHRIEDIFAVFEHDKRILQSELTERIDKTEEKLQRVEVSLDAQTTKRQEVITKNYNETHAAIEETRREFQARLDGTRQTRAERANTPGVGTCSAQPPTFDGNTTWSVFRRQFEVVAKHNQWSDEDKSTYLITALKGRAADVLPGIPTNTTYENTLQALEDRFGDQHFAAAYRCQLTSRTQNITLAFSLHHSTFARLVVFGLKMSLMRRATVPRRGIFWSACIFRVTFSRWFVSLQATASPLWGPQFIWVEDFLKMILLRHATVARPDIFLLVFYCHATFTRRLVPVRATASVLWHPSFPWVRFFLFLWFRSLRLFFLGSPTGNNSASSTGACCCFAASGFLSAEVGSPSS